MTLINNAYPNFAKNKNYIKVPIYMPQKLYLNISLVFIIIYLLPIIANSQCSTTSSDGYTVDISATPVHLNVASTNCEYGYNYTVSMEYNVSFSGANQPSNLWTLNGYLKCGSNSLFFNTNNSQGSGSSTTSNTYSNKSDCAVATVNSLGCSSVDFKIEGPGISSRTISCATGTSLPIELSLFEVKTTINGHAFISWSTDSEINNNFFTIERSSDAINWFEIYHKEGAGNSTVLNKYSYVDTELKGETYYRLKQTDYDGKFTYSNIEVVSSKKEPSVKIFPNPSSNFITLSNSLEVHPTFWTITGQSVSGQVTQLSDDKYDISNLSSGLYVVKSENNVAKFNKVD